MSESLFPTYQWLEAYARHLEDAPLDDLAVGRDTRFDGDLLFVIEDIPVDDTRIGDLPEFVLDGIPEHVRPSVEDVTLQAAPGMFDESVRAGLSETVQDLLKQLETRVIDGTIFAFISLDEDGSVDVVNLQSRDERPVDFVFTAPYTTWREILNGRPAATHILKGDFDIEGDLLGQIQYSALFQELGAVAADVETVHLFDGPSPSPGERLVDVAVSQSVLVHKNTNRFLSQSLRFL